MNVPGVKQAIVAALSNKKLLNNGTGVPAIDVEQSIDFEISAIDTRGLFSIVRFSDDKVVEQGKFFSRSTSFMLSPGCTEEIVAIELVKAQFPALFDRVSKVRIHITKYHVKRRVTQDVSAIAIALRASRMASPELVAA